jgi:hypothetical protein
MVGWLILVPSFAGLALQASRDVGVEPDRVLMLAAGAALLIVLGPAILALARMLGGTISRLSRTIASLLRAAVPSLLWAIMDWLLKTVVLPAVWPLVVTGAMALWYLAFGSGWPF